MEKPRDALRVSACWISRRIVLAICVRRVIKRTFVGKFVRRTFGAFVVLCGMASGIKQNSTKWTFKLKCNEGNKSNNSGFSKNALKVLHSHVPPSCGFKFRILSRSRFAQGLLRFCWTSRTRSFLCASLGLLAFLGHLTAHMFLIFWWLFGSSNFGKIVQCRVWPYFVGMIKHVHAVNHNKLG